MSETIVDDHEDLVKCGYCNAICDEVTVARHKCIQIFKKFFIDPNSKIIWGVNENGEGVYELSLDESSKIKDSNIDKENASNNRLSQKVLCNINRQLNKSTNIIQTKIDEEEQLILEVMNRPPLWDITLPLCERGKVLKNKLWSEVSESIKGCFTADGARRRFKSLTDTFRKMIQNEKCSSGSSRKLSTNKWPHYKTMQFLRNQLNCRPTIGNLEIELDEEVVEIYFDEEDIELEEKKLCRRKIRKRKNVEEHENLMASFDKIAEAISESRDIVLPPPPVLDEIDSCVNVIGCHLRKIPEEQVSATVNNLLNYSFQVLQKYKSY